MMTDDIKMCNRHKINRRHTTNSYFLYYLSIDNNKIYKQDIIVNFQFVLKKLISKIIVF